MAEYRVDIEGYVFVKASCHEEAEQEIISRLGSVDGFEAIEVVANEC